jgi:hypothetical protein
MNKLSEEQLLAEIRLRLDRSIESLQADFAVQLDAARESAVSLSLAEQRQMPDNDDSLLLGGMLDSLDNSSELSPEIERRLDQIRHNAMARISERQESRTSRLSISGLVGSVQAFLFNNVNYPLGMFATACLTVTVVSLFYISSLTDPTAGIEAEEEILLLASADDIELYENLDFYLWLEEVEQAN